MKHKRWIAVALLSGAVAGPAVVAATGVTDVSCHCFTDPSENNHWFTMAANLQYACYNEATCHPDKQWGFCSQSHNACTGDLAATLVHHGALTSEAALAVAADARSVYNPERQSLQIIGCGGQTVASVRVAPQDRDGVIAMLEQKLGV